MTDKGEPKYVVSFLGMMREKMVGALHFSKLGRLLPKGRLRQFLKKTRQLLLETIRPKVEYSCAWYDKVYHAHHTATKSFEDYLRKWEDRGFRERLYEVLDATQLPSGPVSWLEVACMQGKTAYWILARYPEVRMHMFDFSSVAVAWVRENFPQDHDWRVWQCDIQDIRQGERTFGDFFDVITCIDVTEHLPDDIYKNGIREMHRVLRPGGRLILMQGNTPQPEHIHILSEEDLVSDFCEAGFAVVKHLPHRHHLLTKPTDWNQ